MDEAVDTLSAEYGQEMASRPMQHTEYSVTETPRKTPGPPRKTFDPKTVWELAELGLTMEQIAMGCGVSADTLAARIKDTPEITEAFNQGRLSGQIEAVTEIKKQAPKNPIIALFRTKHLVGWHDKPSVVDSGMKVEVTIKAVSVTPAKSRLVEEPIEVSFSDADEDE